MQNYSSDVLKGLLVLFGLLGILYLNNKEEIDRSNAAFLSLPWLWIGVAFVSLILLGLITWRVILYVLRKRKEKWDVFYRNRDRKKFLDKLLSREFSGSSNWLRHKLQDIKDELKQYSSYDEEDQLRIETFFLGVNNTIKQQVMHEQVLEQERLKQEAIIKKQEAVQEAEFERQVQELFEYKKKFGVKALPLDKYYSEKVISQAKFRAKQLLYEKETLKSKREDAIEYYSEHDMNSKPQLRDEWEEDVYAQVREEIKADKLEVKKKVSITYSGEKLDKDFYRAKDLDDDTKRKAVAQGFKHCRGIELEGHFCGGGFYIRKEGRESDYHFYMKHLFAELHENMQIEYLIGDMRADVALLLPDASIALEIETGTNKLEQLAAKIPWLNEHFDQWIFVCPRDQQAKYDKLVDNKKSLCMTPKKAKEFIQGVLAAIEQL